MGSNITIHGVLAGAYAGKRVSRANTLTHASADGGSTALCKRVKEDNLCDVVEDIAELDCPVCIARLERLRAKEAKVRS